MRNFIIVDTWNGEGYTDSSHEIIQANNTNDVHDYAIGRAQECITIDMGELEEHRGDTYGYISYHIGDDYGCIHWEYLSDDALAVCINPIVNEYWMVESQSQLQDMVSLITEHSEEDFEDEPVFNGYHHHALKGDGDIKMESIKEVEVILNDVIPSDSIEDAITLLESKGYHVMDTEPYCYWTVLDVKITFKNLQSDGKFKGIKYTDELGQSVMDYISKCFDADYGVTWDSIEYAIEVIINLKN